MTLQTFYSLMHPTSNVVCVPIVGDFDCYEWPIDDVIEQYKNWEITRIGVDTKHSKVFACVTESNSPIPNTVITVKEVLELFSDEQRCLNCFVRTCASEVNCLTFNGEVIFIH